MKFIIPFLLLGVKAFILKKTFIDNLGLKWKKAKLLLQ